ncbi:hypothetical protein [Fischerella sp. NIES-3754]|uniref:hypothetical protein n=1 Tax=Fischerella sp. NIES-3754 TaxID=1752063 RepID=UPI0015D9306A|nr:hypothetical protein [Fischerella sp. NIES-3754]
MEAKAIGRNHTQRHDLVHRNGKTKERQEIAVDEVVVDEIMCRIESFVNELDQKLKDKEYSEEIEKITINPEVIVLDNF